MVRDNAMHRLFSKANGFTGDVTGSAMEIHRLMGPGLMEGIYERCLMHELELRGIAAVNQKPVVIT